MAEKDDYLERLRTTTRELADRVQAAEVSPMSKPDTPRPTPTPPDAVTRAKELLAMPACSCTGGCMLQNKDGIHRCDMGQEEGDQAIRDLLAHVEAVERERDEWAQEAGKTANALGRSENNRVAAEARCARALEFAQHKDGCPLGPNVLFTERSCTCGLDAVRDARPARGE